MASVTRLPLLLSNMASSAAVCSRRVARLLAMSAMLKTPVSPGYRGVDSFSSADLLGVAAHAELLLKTVVGGPVTALTWLLVSTTVLSLFVDPSSTTTNIAMVHVCSVAAWLLILILVASLRHSFGLVSELTFPVFLASFDLLNAVVVAVSAAMAAGRMLFQYMSSANFCCSTLVPRNAL